MQAVHDKSEVSVGEYLLSSGGGGCGSPAPSSSSSGWSWCGTCSRPPSTGPRPSCCSSRRRRRTSSSPTAQSPDPTRAVQNELRVINSRVVRADRRRGLRRPRSRSSAVGRRRRRHHHHQRDRHRSRGGRPQGQRLRRDLPDRPGRRPARRPHDVPARSSSARSTTSRPRSTQVNAPLAAIDQQIVDTPVDDPRLAVPAGPAGGRGSRRTEAQRRSSRTSSASTSSASRSSSCPSG